MPKIKQLSKLEILNETIQFYGEDNNRRAIEESSCLYNTSDGRHCAVGRCFLKRIKSLGINFKQNSGVTPDMIDDFEKKLLAKYRGHSDKFWLNLQMLHDDDGVWDEKGLTERGERKVKEFKEIFDIIE